jgi:hypothetical protein
MMWLAMKPFAPVTRTVEPFSIGGMVLWLRRWCCVVGQAGSGGWKDVE